VSGHFVCARAPVTSTYRYLAPLRPHGYPAGEASWGLDYLFGRGNWCPKCGLPSGPRIGSLVLQRAGVVRAGRLLRNIWVPYWMDRICVAMESAEEIRSLGVSLKPVCWGSGAVAPQVMEIIPTPLEMPLFNPEMVASLSREQEEDFDGLFSNEETAQRMRELSRSGPCSLCGRWKWRVSGYGKLPLRREVVARLASADSPIVCGAEAFGYGAEVNHPTLFRSDVVNALLRIDPSGLDVADIPDEVV